MPIDPSEFEDTDGPLRFFRADRVTVLLGADTLGGYRQLCQVTFNRRSGDIYLQFPYYKQAAGAVGLFRAPIREDMTSGIVFDEQARVVTSKVKYSHPANGRAHFSQDGQHRTTFFASSLPLTNGTGHLGELHAYGLGDFELLPASKQRKNRLYLPFRTETDPAGAAVVFEWKRRDELKTWAAEEGIIVAPIGKIPRTTDRSPYMAALVGQPLSSPLQEHLLAISVSPLEPLAGHSESDIVFLGGWRHPPQKVAPGTAMEILAFTYPVRDPEAMARRIGSADFQG